MKSVIFGSRLSASKVFFLLTLLTTLAAGFSKSSPIVVTSCQPPINLTITGQTTNTVSFAWDSIEEGASFKVWYLKEGAVAPSQAIVTSNEYITLTNLSPGNYKVYVLTICETGESGYIIYDDLIM